MTLANKITVVRFFLIPVFIVFAAYYSESITSGEENRLFRILALATYALASISDAVDGYIARNFNQSTPLGRVLDPIADKLLLLTGVVTLSITNWHAGLPIWFAVLVIARDVVISVGMLIIYLTHGKAKVRARISGKICTFLTLSCVCWVLVDFWSVGSRPWPLEVLIYLAALFTVVTGYLYLGDGIRQLRESGHTLPDSDVP
ncbi:MAG: CDP-alcohol phosphatidyltransferase family protein [Verrucomicrobiales bacterium]|jgi:CDP-diacylglycerol--glycerol-3-phosphate 3-phosphatidyltransferase|nr:CDP-alcohol phosphatidyltransferase family protein [Verrucomicrobiales bacterium]